MISGQQIRVPRDALHVVSIYEWTLWKCRRHFTSSRLTKDLCKLLKQCLKCFRSKMKIIHAQGYNSVIRPICKVAKVCQFPGDYRIFTENSTHLTTADCSPQEIWQEVILKSSCGHVSV
jgi:hypothetical protein